MSQYRPHLRGRLREAFAQAARTEIMQRLRSPKEFEDARKITEYARVVRAEIEALYRQRYEARVVQESKRVREESVARSQQLKPRWVQEDRLDAEFVRAVAEKRVRGRHESRKASIDAWETAALRRLARLPAREVEKPIRMRVDFERARSRTRTA